MNTTSTVSVRQLLLTECSTAYHYLAAVTWPTEHAQ